MNFEDDEGLFVMSMETLKTGVVLVALAAITSIGSAEPDFSHRNAFATESIAANQDSQSQLANHGTAVARLDSSITQLIELTGTDSDLNHTGLVLIDLFETTSSAPSAGLGGSVGSNVFGADFGSTQVDQAQIESKTNPTIIVPLPTSAIAGMGMLLSIAGIRYMRTRK